MEIFFKVFLGDLHVDKKTMTFIRSKLLGLNKNKNLQSLSFLRTYKLNTNLAAVGEKFAVRHIGFDT